MSSINDIGTLLGTSPPSSSTSSSSAALLMGQLTSNVNGPIILQPGEVIRTSGKFPKPTKIPGKNYSKDEVVIRNADSGKGKIFCIFILWV